MTIAVNFGRRPRALIGAVRADASDPKALFEELSRSVSAFREAHERELKSKVDDVVLTEQVDRINAAISSVEERINEMTTKQAGTELAGGRSIVDSAYIEASRGYMRGGVEASLKKTADADGGYLAPVEWDRTLTGRLKEVSEIRRFAQVLQTSKSGFRKIFTDRAVGSGWVGETAGRPETGTPAFSQLDFTMGEAYANPSISQQMLDDAEFDIENWLIDELRTEFNKVEGNAVLAGSGVNQPYGLLTYVTGAANAARHPWGAIQTTSSGAAAAISSADGVLSLIEALPAAYRPTSRLFFSQNAIFALRKLKDSTNAYLWQPSMALGAPATFAGVPVETLTGLPAVAANAIVGLYGDMAQTYLIVERTQFSMLRDPYTNKPFVHFYCTRRVGGGVQNPDTMKAFRIAA